jgi:ATP-binding cassette, subfamily B, bacterial
MDRNQIVSREASEEKQKFPGFLSKEDKEGVVINDIHFSYRSRADIPVLSGLSLKISQKNITAIVGRSGSGKSTLLSLICGLYKQNSNKTGSSGIWIDGESIDTLGDKIKGKIGVVEQNACLFSGTIYENIAYGKVISEFRNAIY